MKGRSFALAIVIAGVASTISAAPQKIDLPRDTSHPEQDANRAIERGDLSLIGVNGFAFTLPEIEGRYQYNRFSRRLYSHLKAIRGTSDMHNGPADGFINERARAYTARYNRVLLNWLEKHHPNWLGPRQPLTH